MAKPLLSHEDLDTWLLPALTSPERFEELAADLIRVADEEGRDLAIRSPLSWREVKPGAQSVKPGNFLNQFRADVDTILPMDREEESRLARRIEFARLRLEGAQARHDLAQEDVEEGIGHPGLGWSKAAVAEVIRSSSLPREVSRRWVELHSLRTELVERNLYLVLINVERYAQTGASRVDLIQEGCISLFRAVDGFDWRRGLLFRTYAVHWLNQAFRNYLYNFGHTVRVPIYLQKVMKQVQEARIRLGDPKASSLEIATEGQLDEHLVETALSASRISFSLDAELGGSTGAGAGGRLGDYLQDGHDFDEELGRMDRTTLEHDLLEALGHLKERERFVVRMRFGLGVDREHTLAEVAHQLGISVERVRQIQMSALRKLGSPGLRRQFAAYLN